MNRLLITELGDTLRTEIKRDHVKQNSKHNSNTKNLPEIKNYKGSGVLFMEMEKNENPLYSKSLSDQALINLSKVANLSLFGPKSKEQLENHLREDLTIKKKEDYMNLCLGRCVDKILDDKNLMTKRKRQLLNELKKLEARERVKQFHHMPTDLSQFSSIVEDTDREQKLMSIVNMEGKLLQLQRRYEQKQQEDQKLKSQVRNNYLKFKEGQIMQIEALPVLTQEDMENDVKDIFTNRDQSNQRFHQRLTEKHVKEKEIIWRQHHFPKQHKRWLSK